MLIDKIKYYKNLCFGKDKFVHYDLGWNYRMTDIQAAIAYAQFEKLETTIREFWKEHNNSLFVRFD